MKVAVKDQRDDLELRINNYEGVGMLKADADKAIHGIEAGRDAKAVADERLRLEAIFADSKKAASDAVTEMKTALTNVVARETAKGELDAQLALLKTAEKDREADRDKFVTARMRAAKAVLWLEIKAKIVKAEEELKKAEEQFERDR